YERLVEERLDVEVIPDPNAPRVRAPDFVASYANYYVCNGAVIAAQFGDRETDAEAQKALSKLYPEREIVTLNVDALGETGGGIHCATKELPAS
ncbi:MAG: agmatine deiminase family protein, partial [Pseudomonadota bacterium]